VVGGGEKGTRRENMTDKPTLTCDICFWQTAAWDDMAAHLLDLHSITDPAPVGSVTQADGILTLAHAD
jgi:hypothetical protein